MPLAPTTAGRAELRTTSAPLCWLCGTAGESAYRGLSDTRGRVPGQWNWRRCSRCGSMWLDPRPAPEQLPRLYTDYYTHAQGNAADRRSQWRERARLAVLSTLAGYEALAASRWQRRLARLALLLPPCREMAELGLMGLARMESDPCGCAGAPHGRLLDVGCGSGRFLAAMRRAGWQVWGIEPDPQAAAAALERYGIEVGAAGIEQARLPAGSFDAVVLSHVIEHVADPLALLSACRGVLRPGGVLALSTPNVASRGHRRFGPQWLHLDVPRHLLLFSQASLAALLERAGFERPTVVSAAKSAASTWLSSRDAGSRRRPLASARALAFHLAEFAAIRRGQACGEELFAWARRDLGECPLSQGHAGPCREAGA